VYDSAMLDDRQYDGLDAEDRAAAEAAMKNRDRMEGRFRTSRLASALESDDGKAGVNIAAAVLGCNINLRRGRRQRRWSRISRKT
jgi:hypothetical protein